MIEIPAPPAPPAPRPQPGPVLDEAALRAAARAFEAAFLAEMLTAAGVGRTPESFGGGAGEDAFASFLTREHARLMAERGGVGVAEAVFRALAAQAEVADAAQGSEAGR